MNMLMKKGFKGGGGGGGGVWVQGEPPAAPFGDMRHSVVDYGVNIPTPYLRPIICFLDQPIQRRMHYYVSIYYYVYKER